MSEVLLLQERIANTIQLGESHFREFKSAFDGPPDAKKPRNPTAICRDIGEALVAFANADGGELLIGVEDDGTITGIPHDSQNIEKMMSAIDTHIYHGQSLPILFKERLLFDGKVIIFFSVNKANDRILQTPDGRCVRRKDRETIPIDIQSIMIDRAEQKSREFDREFIDGATVADLDVDLIAEIASTYFPGGISVEKYLQQVGLGEYTSAGIRLRRAALILFAKKIDQWIPRSEIRVIKVNGTELKSGTEYNVTTDERFSGNAFGLLANGWDFLRPFLIVKTEFGTDATFESRYVYPEIACREALVNAIAHRDYSITNSIDFILYQDRLTIKSPGLLLSTIKISDLLAFKNVHESRNTYVAKILRERKIMRELGEGIKRIYDILNDSEIGLPKIESVDSSFSLTIENKSIYSAKEIEWLSLFDSYKLTKEQKRIVALGLHDKEISPHDIYSALNTRDRNMYDSTVTSLRVIQVMQEIRRSPEASNIARKTGIQKQKIGRFKIVAPGRTQILNQEKILNAIFVYNLPVGVSDDDLRSFFEKFGSVKKFSRPTYGQSKTSYNYCFVHFDDANVAQDLIRKKTITVNEIEANISEYITNNINRRRGLKPRQSCT